MSLEFIWDEAKAAHNLQKHGVDFLEAMRVFMDPLSRTLPDPDHSLGEHRYITMGCGYNDRLLVVAHTDREDLIRIISARFATRGERRKYEEE